MSDGTSVGVISLDLVIKNKVQEQLDRISSSIQKGFEKPVEQAAQTAQKVMEQSSKTAEKAVESSAEKMEDTQRQAIDECLKNIRKYNKSVESAVMPSAAKPEIVTYKVDTQYDTAKVEAEVDKIAKSITEKSDKAAKKAAESFADFEVPDDKLERLNLQLDNAAEKMGILQARYKELQSDLSAAETDEQAAETVAQLNKLESQLISQQNTIDKTKAKISEAENAGVKAMQKYLETAEKTAKQAAETERQQMEKARQSAISAYTQTAKGFETAADSVGLLKQKIELNSKAMQACESEIKRLKAEYAYAGDAFEGEKIVKKLNAAQRKMISLAETDRKLRNQLDSVGKSGENVGNSIKKGQEKAWRSVNKTQGIFTKLGKSIKSAAKSVFLMSGAYAVFRGIKSAMETAASSNDEFSKSLNEVKANLSVAFTPIMQSVMPYLNALMSGLARVTKAVASFMSGLFGTTYKKSLEAAKAAKNASKQAKKTADEQKRYLASFDAAEVAQDTSSGSSSVSDDDSGVDFDALDSEGDTWAQKLGGSVRKYLTAAFENVRKKGSEIFGYLGKWAEKSFSPTFKDIWHDLEQESLELAQIMGGVFGDIKTLAEPLKTYFESDLTPHLQTVFKTLGNISVGLFDSFNKVFSDIWDIAVFPMIQNFITTGLPLITQFGTQVWNTLDVLFASVKEIFDILWSGAVAPVLGFISQLWCDTWQTISDFWDEWGQPIFDGINTVITTTKDIFLNIWETILQPVFQHFMELLDIIWTEHLQPLIAEFLDLVGELVTGAMDIYNRFIAPVVTWLVDTLGPVVTKILNGIQDIVGNVIGGILDSVRGVIKALKGVVQFVSGIFTGNWKKAWQGIKNIFKGVWNALSGIAKTPINLIIGMINKLTGAVQDAINWIVDKVNTLSFDVPDWVPGIGGKTFGFDLQPVSIPEIPKLATGGLAAAPTLAMVGDNPNARTDPEVISPLSKLKDMLDGGRIEEVIALLRQIAELLKAIDPVVYATVDRKVLFEAVVKENNGYRKRTGASAF